MLIAKRECGSLFSVAQNKDRHFLEKLRQEEKFYCPSCNETVILKLGWKRSFHFSHLQASKCAYEIENESEEHLSGKLQLYELLKKEEEEVELEPFIKEISQRPDIMFTYNGKKYVIEFQCSPIKQELFTKRTTTYLKNGYQVIWILSASFLSRKSSNIFSLGDFPALFLEEQVNKNWLLKFYCPSSSHFIFLHDIIPISTRNMFAQIGIIKGENFKIKDLLSFKTNHIEQTKLLNNYNQIIKKQLEKLPLYRSAYQNKFLVELYERRLTVKQLPRTVHLPLQSSIFIKSAPYIWQTYIYLDNFHNVKLGKIIYLEDIFNNFKRRLEKGDIKLRQPLLFSKNYYNEAIYEYLQTLVNLKLIRKLDQDTYKIVDNFN